MRRAAKVDANHAAVVKAFRECATCRALLHRKQKTFCSIGCMLKSHHGASNPNFKGGPTKACVGCGGTYSRYGTRGRYCSHACYVKHSIEDIRARGLRGAFAPRKPRVKLAPKTYGNCPVCGGVKTKPKAKTCGWDCAQVLKRASRGGRALNSTCAQCAVRYHTYEKGRLYCSYPCFVASGGPLRAGLEAAKATMRYGAKRDANHTEIIDTLRSCGVAVYDTASIGNGFPDLVAWASNGWHLIEIKNKKTGYGKRGLNPIQRKWAEQWKGGPIILIHSIDEATRFAAGDMSELVIIKCGKPQGD